MKNITGYLLSAVVLALAGGALIVAASLDRDIATAQEHVVAQKYNDVEPTYETAEKYYDYASHVPGIGDGPANDIRTKHATLHYWQKDYAAVIPQQTDPVGSVAQDNSDLQLVVANAVYRAAQSKMRFFVFESCLDSPFTQVRRRRPCGSPSSSGVVIQGPIGPCVSNDLPIVQVGTRSCQSRTVTSSTQR